VTLPDLDPALESVTLHTACGSPDTAVQTAAYHALWHYLYRVAAAMTRTQPDGDALAQDCAQRALLRIHQQFQRCEEPKAFRVWRGASSATWSSTSCAAANGCSRCRKATRTPSTQTIWKAAFLAG